jgi:ribosomal protein S6
MRTSRSVVGYAWLGKITMEIRDRRKADYTVEEITTYKKRWKAISIELVEKWPNVLRLITLEKEAEEREREKRERKEAGKKI